MSGEQEHGEVDDEAGPGRFEDHAFGSDNGRLHRQHLDDARDVLDGHDQPQVVLQGQAEQVSSRVSLKFTLTIAMGFTFGRSLPGTWSKSALFQRRHKNLGTKGQSYLRQFSEVFQTLEGVLERKVGHRNQCPSIAFASAIPCNSQTEHNLIQGSSEPPNTLKQSSEDLV